MSIEAEQGISKREADFVVHYEWVSSLSLSNFWSLLCSELLL